MLVMHFMKSYSFATTCKSIIIKNYFQNEYQFVNQRIHSILLQNLLKYTNRLTPTLQQIVPPHTTASFNTWPLTVPSPHRCPPTAHLLRFLSYQVSHSHYTCQNNSEIYKKIIISPPHWSIISGITTVRSTFSTIFICMSYYTYSFCFAF